jgi:hypothetical protein
MALSALAPDLPIMSARQIAREAPWGTRRLPSGRGMWAILPLVPLLVQIPLGTPQLIAQVIPRRTEGVDTPHLTAEEGITANAVLAVATISHRQPSR